MNKEQCREAGATMIAWANGKTIQWRRRDQSEWHDIEPACTATILSWDWDEFEYRVKPMPKLRPWTADEVPARACRIIERELNAANERIKRLEGATQERDKEWFQIIESILGFHPVSITEALRIGIKRIKEQKQRIKRLEEAGDELAKWADRNTPVTILNDWTRAKEAKP